jgi:hypothetical protein
MRKLVGILLVCLLGACDSCKAEPQPDLIRSTDAVIQSLRFVRDERTGLCFGVTWVGVEESEEHGGPVVVTVPCKAAFPTPTPEDPLEVSP